MRRAVFLDRDGTINEDVGYLFKPEHIQLIPGAIEAMRALQKDFDLFIVTNQSGINEKAFTLADYERFEKTFEALLASHSVHIKRTYCCPHTNLENCVCRTPSDHFLKEAARDFGIDLSASYVVGDHPHDVEMGQEAGLKGIYVLTGHGAKHRDELTSAPDYIARDLSDAAQWILKDSLSDGTR